VRSSDKVTPTLPGQVLIGSEHTRAVNTAVVSSFGHYDEGILSACVVALLTPARRGRRHWP